MLTRATLTEPVSMYAEKSYVAVLGCDEGSVIRNLLLTTLQPVLEPLKPVLSVCVRVLLNTSRSAALITTLVAP